MTDPTPEQVASAQEQLRPLREAVGIVDLPTLIADVYRACGFEIEIEEGGVRWVQRPPDRAFVINHSLDAFIRYIVPALDAKELEVTIWRRNLKWQVDISEIPTGMVLFATARYDSPVEACFRAAWEALKDG